MGKLCSGEITHGGTLCADLRSSSADALLSGILADSVSRLAEVSMTTGGTRFFPTNSLSIYVVPPPMVNILASRHSLSTGPSPS